MSAAIGRRLAPGRGARVEDAFAGHGCRRDADELRGLVLDDEQPLARQRRRQGIPFVDDQSVAERIARGASGRRPRPGRQQDRRGWCAGGSRAASAARVGCRTGPRGRGIEPVPVPPSGHEPARMRQRDGEIVELGAGIAGARCPEAASVRVPGWLAAEIALTSAAALRLPALRARSTASFTAAEAGTRSDGAAGRG